MITGYVVGETEVGVRLDLLEGKARFELSAGIGKLAAKLNARVQRDKLSGQVLGVRSGRLRRSIKDLVTDEGANVVGIVSTNVGYGIGWELGWPDSETRTSLNAAKGKFSLSGGGDQFKNGTPKKRSFLVSALKDFEASGEIRTELEAVAERTVS